MKDINKNVMFCLVSLLSTVGSLSSAMGDPGDDDSEWPLIQERDITSNQLLEARSKLRKIANEENNIAELSEYINGEDDMAELSRDTYEEDDTSGTYRRSITPEELMEARSRLRKVTREEDVTSELGEDIYMEDVIPELHKKSITPEQLMEAISKLRKVTHENDSALETSKGMYEGGITPEMLLDAKSKLRKVEHEEGVISEELMKKESDMRNRNDIRRMIRMCDRIEKGATELREQIEIFRDTHGIDM